MGFGDEEDEMEARKKRLIFFGVSFGLVVVSLIGVAVGSRKGKAEDGRRIIQNNHEQNVRAADIVCSPADYKEICRESLKNNFTKTEMTGDAHDLISATFVATVLSIKDAMKNATVEWGRSFNQRYKLSLGTCTVVMNRAISDSYRAMETFYGLENKVFYDAVADIEMWLSAAMAHRETCVDAFREINAAAGETAEKMFEMVRVTTTNALAVVKDIPTIFKNFNLTQPSVVPEPKDDDPTGMRRLLSDGSPSRIDKESRPIPPSTSPGEIIIMVAVNGGGEYKSINDAIMRLTSEPGKRIVIHIKEGVYAENILIPKRMKHLTFVGDGPTKTRITGNLSLAISNLDTYRTPTLAIDADWFFAKDIGIENTAGPKGRQAVALRVSADQVTFYNCHIDGYQNTLYVHTYRQFYRKCRISGTVDFVFGYAMAVFQNCDFLIRRPMKKQRCTVTGQGRTDAREPTGIVLHDCLIDAHPDYKKAKAKHKGYLGRPWKQYSRTIIMGTIIGDVINPEGWLPLHGSFALDTLFYAEYNNSGPGSVQNERVKWLGIKTISHQEALGFTPPKFLRGDRWMNSAGVPFLRTVP